MLTCNPAIGTNGMIVGLVLSSWFAAPALAQRQDAAPIGRVQFDFPDAPPATVEVDLNEGMMMALSGIGQAAVGGVAEALLESEQGKGTPEITRSAEHLQAVNRMVSELTGTLHEVRVRVYDNLSDVAPETRSGMIQHYMNQLQGSSWDSIVRVNDRGSKVSVNVLRLEGSIRGILVVVSEQHELVLVNAVCDLSPERVKQVAHGATLIGMKFGLDKAIQQAMVQVERELH